MANNQEIDEQQALLTLHRRTLGTYLKREAIVGAAHLPPEVTHGIIEARNEIRRIKSMLRVWGVDVEDNSNDEPHVEDNSNDKPVKYHQVAKHSLLLSRSSLILSAIICVFVTLIFVIMVYRWNIYTDFLMSRAHITFGPNNWTIDQKRGTTTLYTPPINVRNFAVEAKFSNPYDSNEQGGWSYGFTFRPFKELSNSKEISGWYALYLKSDTQQWVLEKSIQDGSKLEQPKIATGKLSNLDISPSGENVVRLICNGSNVIIFVNGIYISSLYLSTEIQPAGVGIGTGYEGLAISGKTTPYKDFSIWSLDS